MIISPMYDLFEMKGGSLYHDGIKTLHQGTAGGKVTDKYHGRRERG
jgi:hypothetical protein